MPTTPPSVEKIHLIFKTHLDLGFTDLANTVFRRYMDDFIPAALRLARELRVRGGEERFLWTTGSWLIYHYLEQATPSDRAQMEAAILAGDIVWHALPFTTHSELLDAHLFRFGLSLSQQLDARFGRTTIAAKMTDVPGHTRAIVPLMAEAGIKLLHLGVNEASTPPNVPPVFVWRDVASGHELLVIYEHSYGDLVQVAGLPQVMVLRMMGDNVGTPTVDDIQEIYDDLRARFPTADITPTTMDTFASALDSVRASLPVVTGEIGDSWIHGGGTDPQKLAAWRRLMRLQREVLADQGLSEAARFSFQEALLCVGEHTWGMDVKLHLAEFTAYSAAEFAVARPSAAFQTMESSWAEQRAYLDRAIAALAGTRLHGAAVAALLPPKPMAHPLGKRTQRLQFSTPQFEIGIDADTGAISYLRANKDGRIWATADHPLALFRYETFDQASYDRFWAEYIHNKDRDSVVAWALYDYTKPGIAGKAERIAPMPAALDSLYTDVQNVGLTLTATLSLPAAWTIAYGAPPAITLTLFVHDAVPQIDVRLSWRAKPACRLPEALWMSWMPLASGAQWRFEKVGQWIDPTEVVSGGNRGLHAVFDRIQCQLEDQTLTLTTCDAALVAPGTPSLLRFTDAVPDMNDGVHINLVNNLWGTNFPQWNDGDADFEFQLRW